MAFPLNPVDGETYIEAGTNYVFASGVWKIAPAFFTKAETTAEIDKAIVDLMQTSAETLATINAIQAALDADQTVTGQILEDLSSKAEAADVYTKPEVDTALAAKAATASVYTKPQVDALIAAIPAGGGSSGPIAFNALTDVTITTPVDGDKLVYDATAGQWENAPKIAPENRLRFPDGGRGFGRTILRGVEILRAGSIGTNRPHAIGIGDTYATTVMPVAGVADVESWLKFYDGISYYLALSDKGVIYMAGDDSVGQQGTERVKAGNDSSWVMRPVTDANVFGSNVIVEDIFSPDYNLLDGHSQGNPIVVVKNKTTNVYTNYTWGGDGWRVSSGASSGNKLFPTALTELPAGKKIVKFHGCTNFAHMAVLDDGTVWGIGYNGNGALGTGNKNSPTAYTQAKLKGGAFVTGAADVKYMVSNGSGTNGYVLLANGEVLAAGSNGNRQLADGTTTERETFDYVLTANNVRLTNIRKIALTYAGALFLDASGNVWHAGYNNDGIRGDGTTFNVAPTSSFATICQTGVTDIMSNDPVRGTSFVFYLKTDGKLYSAGWNGYGTLGGSKPDGNYSTISEVHFPKGERPVALKCVGQRTEGADSHMGLIALTDKNRVFGWGRNYAGACIHGLPESIPSPQLIRDFGIYTI